MIIGDSYETFCLVTTAVQKSRIKVQHELQESIHRKLEAKSSHTVTTISVNQ